MRANISAPFLRAPYNYDLKEASEAVGLVCEGPGKTKQSFKEECDINVIVRRFGLTGKLPNNVRAPTYGDFTQVEDFRDAITAVMLAEEAFMTMPASVRSRFSNDPAAFVDFCSNPANRQEALDLGLIDLPPESATPPAAAPAASAKAP